MKKEFLIENGALIKYEGKSDEVIIPDEVTTINSYAIQSAKRVVLNSNCKRICEHAIGDAYHPLYELVIPSDSKLSIIEKHAIAYGIDTKPVILPDGIKVLNGGMPPIANLPKKLQTIKRYAFSVFENSTKNIIYYLPETLKKIENGLNRNNIYLTKNNKLLDGWNIDDHEINNIVFNVVDETIYEFGDFKYVICEDDDGPYAAIVSIPLNPFVFVPEKINDYIVKVVCFVPNHFYSTMIMPALYVSKHVFQISRLWENPVLIGDEFNVKITSNKAFTKLEENEDVYSGNKKEDIKHKSGFYYISRPEGIAILCYDGEESKVVFIPDEIDGEPVISVASEAFQFLKGKVEFIKYPEKCKFPRWSKTGNRGDGEIMANKHKVFNDPIINPCFKVGETRECSAEIIDFVEQDGFKMIHIKDIDEEGYVIVDLHLSIKQKQIMNPPTKINNLKVLGISWSLLKSYYMNSEMAKRYYSIYKKLY